MNYRYSDYTMEQLREEVGRLKEKALKAESEGKLSHVSINERKIQIVMSYMVNPDDFKADDIHELNGDPGHTFKINYINGVMAWGIVLIWSVKCMKRNKLSRFHYLGIK